MQVKNPNPYQFLKNSPNDIKLSLWEYYDLIDCLLDDRLSADGLMKFKELYRCNSIQTIIVPILSFPVAWTMNRWLFGWVNRGLAQSRFNLMGMAMFYPLALYLGCTQYRKPRKLYTETIGHDGDDGQYVREMIATRKPGLWNQIVPQLENLGYNYKQMTGFSASSNEFPTTFFSSKDL